MIDPTEVDRLIGRLEARAAAAPRREPVQPEPGPADHARARIAAVAPALRNGAFIARRLAEIRRRTPPARCLPNR
jgi:hypothetical protein